jgi:signal transduction histidine kinase
VERLATSETPFVHDGNLMAQALTNLIRNAAEAMGESASTERRLRIGARRSRRALPDGRRIDHLIYRVEDSGPGVPADLVERIFHPFFTTRQEGTGLGLAIVHRIVDAHGGSIAIENQLDPATRAVHGARFEIALPLKRAEATRRTLGEGGDALANAVRRRIGRVPLENAETG